mmetsp:Transcript_36433/g.103636  ORF Transcript_36433/g.103636 Transcript_36433/m.103636 type:complete len:229 (-) Transcript_36433:229-915(-)
MAVRLKFSSERLRRTAKTGLTCVMCGCSVKALVTGAVWRRPGRRQGSEAPLRKPRRGRERSDLGRRRATGHELQEGVAHHEVALHRALLDPAPRLAAWTTRGGAARPIVWGAALPPALFAAGVAARLEPRQHVHKLQHARPRGGHDADQVVQLLLLILQFDLLLLLLLLLLPPAILSLAVPFLGINIFARIITWRQERPQLVHGVREGALRALAATSRLCELQAHACL